MGLSNLQREALEALQRLSFDALRDLLDLYLFDIIIQAWEKND